MYSSSPVRHAGLFWCLTSADRSPVAVLSDTLCLTFFKPEFLRSLIWEFCSVTFAKTFEKWIDHHVWQMYRKLFLNYSLYHIVLSDICQTGQKWAKTAYGVNRALGSTIPALRVPPTRSTRVQATSDRFLASGAPYSRLCLTSGVWHPEDSKFYKKWELFFTKIILTKNPFSNFLRFSQNLWRRYTAWW